MHIFVVHLYNTVVKMIIVAPNIQMYPKDSFPIHCDYRKGNLLRKIIGNPMHLFVVHLYNTVVKMIMVAPNIQMYPKDSFSIHSFSFIIIFRMCTSDLQL